MDLTAIFRERYRDAELQREGERSRVERDIRDQIAAGNRDPALILRLAGLLAPEAAIKLLRDACAESGKLALHLALIRLLEDCNKTEEAVTHAEAALTMFPGDPRLQFPAALILPIVYDSQTEVKRWRKRFSEGLTSLAASLVLDTPERRQAALEAVGSRTNFYLAYQGENDCDLQRQYAELVCRIVTAAHPECVSPLSEPPPSADGRIRIGYISGHLWRHSVFNALGGWILNHNREKFEIFSYQIEGKMDGATDEVRLASDHFTQLSGDFEKTCAAIRADRLHVAIFLDVGMLPKMTLLSSVRFAPVQCATWGHPVTTGSPNMDYYLSSELMEPAGGDQDYSERVIRLPGIGSCYRKPLIPKAIVDFSRSRFGLREGSVYLGCQSVYKYLPVHDDVFARIAKRVAGSQFVFVIQNELLAVDFRKRLNRAFDDEGMSADEHCLILPRLGMIEYWGLHRTADVFLDSLGWSGLNTVMEAVASGLPVVTLRGPTMRGGGGYAILRQVDVPDTIAEDKDNYVDIAVRLALDSSFRREVVRKMVGHYSLLYSDMRSVVALEKFLDEAVHERLRPSAVN